jgi:hypothetical protein
MHQDAGHHVLDYEIIVVAVAERCHPRHCPLLRVGVRNLTPLRRGMFFPEDADGQLREVLQFDLLLLLEARCQLARVEDRNAQESNEAETDQRIDLSADRHSEPAQYRKWHLEFPQSRSAAEASPSARCARLNARRALACEHGRDASLFALISDS